MILKTKIILFAILLFIATLGIAFGGLHALSDSSHSDNIARINQLMKSTANIVAQFEQFQQSGELSETQAKSLAIQVLRENKYHDSEYVYVVDNNMNFVATPHDPQLHGTSFNDFVDANGQSIGQMVQQLVGSQTGKILTYEWTSQREGQVVSLTSVVQQSELWHWYVGTGISYAEADARYWSVASGLLTFAVIVAIILSLSLARFGFKLHHSLGAEIEQVHQFVLSVSRGNLRQQSTLANAPDNSVVGAMNYMQVGLQGVVQGIKSVADVLHHQTDSSSQRSHELDKLTRAMHDETQMVASAITELTASSANVVQHAKQTAASVNAAEQQGINAHRLTQESATTISLLETQIESAGKNIQILDDEVSNIASVLQVIQGIAEQTNLLALNAAIEAARAGEQGRGFAVVADEVRQLAQRTQTSTEQIKQMIDKLQKATQDAKSSVVQSIATSEETVTKSVRVADELKNIAQSLSDIAHMSQQISEAATEQLAAGEDSAQRIVLIADTASKTNEVSEKAHSDSEQVKLLTDKLEVEIHKFQI
ncbi:methyl-accepting chemotaxis protein [Shewanella aestuarii]|uniref:Methyl-accepting chemotaxis protein n=1 Tax=Shewanella aestuarii TaxID=1028752 RepID=A0A6G9QMT7_9GAMM|nr:methyl-accepting chemotaxis protein [Shewanella aestuarii]QIR15385.1 methyl-accepting chemotaxis protein [Shewanella aestuarii]